MGLFHWPTDIVGWLLFDLILGLTIGCVCAALIVYFHVGHNYQVSESVNGSIEYLEYEYNGTLVNYTLDLKRGNCWTYIPSTGYRSGIGEISRNKTLFEDLLINKTRPYASCN